MIDRTKSGPLRKLDLVSSLLLNEGTLILTTGIILVVNIAWWIAVLVMVFGALLIIAGVAVDRILSQFRDEVLDIRDGDIIYWKLNRVKVKEVRNAD